MIYVRKTMEAGIRKDWVDFDKILKVWTCFTVWPDQVIASLQSSTL